MLGLILISSLGWLVLDDGKQLGDVPDTFGYPLSEENLCSHLQIFWMLDELEENHRFLSRPQLLLLYSGVAREQESNKGRIINEIGDLGQIQQQKRGFSGTKLEINLWVVLLNER